MYKIIIAEDDSELRQMFSQVLTRNGFFVKGFSDGKSALEEIEKGEYDLVISDIMMPEMDGYTLARELREKGSKIPILMITAKDAFNDMYMGFHSGTDDYMVKPININEMVLRVNALIRRAQMLNDRRQVIGSTIMEWDSLTVVSNVFLSWKDIYSPSTHGRYLGV